MYTWILITITVNLHVLVFTKDINLKVMAKMDQKSCSKDNEEQPLNRVDTTKRLAALREVLDSSSLTTPEDKLQVLFITSDDEHQTEFVSDYDKRLQYISGFSGSSGDALISKEAAALWTDSRYHIQADEELDCNWLLMKAGNNGVLSKTEWLHANFPTGAKIGADPKLIAAHVWHRLETELQELNKNFTLLKTTTNLIDAIWVDHHEVDNVKPGFTVDISYTGKNWSMKVNETREVLKLFGADAIVVTALDEIAWLLNIRGSDILHSYLMKGYVILSQNKTILYIDPAKIAGNISKYFENYPKSTNYTVKFRNYSDIWLDLPKHSETWNKILLPSSYVYSPGVSKRIYDAVPKEKRISEPSPIIDLKAQKNPTEILGMERAHIRDAVAMCNFFSYFETRFKAGEVWDEVRVAQELDRFRREQDLCLNISFATIAGFGSHGALPHYQATTSTASIILNNSTLVIDSGGQYYDGTTDVTRTIHMGTPTKEQKEMYTRVLMGTIKLSSLVFPDSLNAASMDVLTRASLWEIGYDYMHGTSHGIGAFLNVHESPISIFYKSRDVIRFKPGYFLSNEPGFYRANDYGIRLENIMKVVEKPLLKNRHGTTTFLGFEDVTLIPYDLKLIDFSLLSNNHLKWLNNYNVRIRNIVGPELKRQGAEDSFKWMMEHTPNLSEFMVCGTRQNVFN